MRLSKHVDAYAVPLLAGSARFAQNFPTKPVRVIFAFAAKATP